VIPESRDAEALRLDRAGVALSIAAITALVYTIIEAPEWGWLSAPTIAGLTATAVLLATFSAGSSGCLTRCCR
jgi:hypothetical protein